MREPEEARQARAGPGVEHLRRGRFEQAAACLEAEALGPPGPWAGQAARLAAEARVGLGLKHVHADDHLAGRREFERALRLDPLNGLAARLLARALHRGGEPGAALAWLDRAGSRDPEGMDATLVRASCLDALGRRDEARRALDRTLASALRAPFPRRRLERPGRGSGTGAGRDADAVGHSVPSPPVGGATASFHADRRCRIGIRLFDPRPEEAAEHLEAALALNPRYLRARLALGLVRLAQRRAPEAVEELEAARELEPSYPDIRAWLGLARLMGGDARGAVAALERAIALRREFARAQGHLALALHALGRTAEALRAARRAVVRDLDTAWPIGRSALPGLEAEAADGDELERALAIRPGSPDLYLALGRRRWEQGESSEARGAFRSALALQPGYAAAAFELARAEMLCSRVREAEALLTDLTAWRPGWVDAQALLGRSRLLLGDLRGAVRPLRAAVRDRPDLEPARGDLAWALLGLGERPAEAGTRRVA